MYTSDPDTLATTIKTWRGRIDNPRAIVTETRTQRQKGSYWLWLDRLAKKLNDAGIPMESYVIKVPKYATKENLHELCAKAVMTALYPEIKSTEDPKFTTTMQQEVYKHVDHIIAERTSVTVAWPDRFSQGEE